MTDAEIQAAVDKAVKREAERIMADMRERMAQQVVTRIRAESRDRFFPR